MKDRYLIFSSVLLSVPVMFSLIFNEIRFLPWTLPALINLAIYGVVSE